MALPPSEMSLNDQLEELCYREGPKMSVLNPNQSSVLQNQGNVARHTTERLDSFVDAIKGKRLTFARLTA